MSFVVHCFSLFIEVCQRCYCYCFTFVSQPFSSLNHRLLCSLIGSCVFNVILMGPTFMFHIPSSETLLYNHLAYVLFLSTCFLFIDGLQICASRNIIISGKHALIHTWWERWEFFLRRMIASVDTNLYKRALIHTWWFLNLLSIF